MIACHEHLRVIVGSSFREGMGNHNNQNKNMIHLLAKWSVVTNRSIVEPCYTVRGRLTSSNCKPTDTFLCDVFECPSSVFLRCKPAYRALRRHIWYNPLWSYKSVRNASILNLIDARNSAVEIAEIENIIAAPTKEPLKPIKSSILDKLLDNITLIHGNETLKARYFIEANRKKLTCIHWRSENNRKPKCEVRLLNFIRVQQQYPLLFWDARFSINLSWNTGTVMRKKSHLQLHSHMYWRLNGHGHSGAFTMALADASLSRYCVKLYVSPAECSASTGFRDLLLKQANIRQKVSW